MDSEERSALGVHRSAAAIIGKRIVRGCSVLT